MLSMEDAHAGYWNGSVMLKISFAFHIQLRSASRETLYKCAIKVTCVHCQSKPQEFLCVPRTFQAALQSECCISVIIHFRCHIHFYLSHAVQQFICILIRRRAHFLASVVVVMCSIYEPDCCIHFYKPSYVVNWGPSNQHARSVLCTYLCKNDPLKFSFNTCLSEVSAILSGKWSNGFDQQINT